MVSQSINNVGKMKTKLSIDEQIKFLNETVKAKLAPSRLHGVGVVAIRDIEVGERLYAQSDSKQFFTVPYARFNELRTEVSDLIMQRWPMVYNGSMFLSPNDDSRLQSFINHGKPMYDPKTDTILTKVGRGTEITEFYWDMPNSKVLFSHFI